MAAPLSTRLKTAWDSLRGDVNLQEEPTGRRRRIPRELGTPYLANITNGFITGADFNAAKFDGSKKYAIYREMWQSDPEIAGTLALIEWPYLASRWTLEGGSDEIRDFLYEPLFDPAHKQAMPFRELLQHILLYRRYGNYIFERVFYLQEDGTLAAYLSPRPPETVWSWNVEGMRIKSIEQQIYNDHGVYQTVKIPGSRLVSFTWAQEANNVEGESILRSCYGEYFSKKQARSLRNIMTERATGTLKITRKVDGAGIPISLVSGEDDDAITTVKDFTGHQQMYVVESEALGIEFMNTASEGIEKAQAIMDYGDRSYRRRILAEFMLHGNMPHGSRAASDVQQNPFWSALHGDALFIAEKLRRDFLLPMAQANFGGIGIDDVPHLVYTDLRAMDAEEELSAVWKALESGAVAPSDELAKFVMERAGVPREAVDSARKGTVKGAPPVDPPPAPRDRESEDDEESSPPVESASVAPTIHLEARVDAENPDPSDGIFWREPTDLEKLVPLQEISLGMDAADAEADALLLEFRERVIADVTSRADKILDKRIYTKEDIDRIANQKKFIDEYARKLAALGIIRYESGEEDARAELLAIAAALGMATLPKRASITRSASFDPVTSKADTRKVMRSTALATISDYGKKLAQEAAAEVAGQSALPTRSIRDVISRMAALSKNNLLGSGRMILGLGYNHGRHSGAMKGHAEFANYTTMLDGVVCPPCMANDQKAFLVGTVEYFENFPPYSQCDSAANASMGRNRCRCIYVYTYEEVS